MAKGINLECHKREISTKGSLKSLRKQGVIPGVIYGKGVPAVPVTMDQAELSRIFRTRGTGGLYTLTVAGEEPVMALLREVQKGPINGELLHIDFMKVQMGESITAAVPVTVTGDEELMKQGAIIQVGLKEVEIECLPGDLPDSLLVDISQRAMGEKVTAQELEAPAGVKVLTDPDAVILVISHPTRAEEPELTTGEEPEGEAAPEE